MKIMKFQTLALFAIGLMLSGCSYGLRQANQVEISENWLLVGPFKTDQEAGWTNMDMLEEHGGQAQAIPEVGQKVHDKQWVEVQVENGHVDFNEMLDSTEQVIGYAYTTIHSPSDQWVFLNIYNDDNAIMWLNGEEIGEWTIGSKLVPVRLNEGVNRALFKVQKFGGLWRLTLSSEGSIRLSVPAFTPNDDKVNDTVGIQVALAEKLETTIKIFDKDSQPVRTLADNEMVDSESIIEWDGRNNDGELMAAGNYVIKVTTADGAAFSEDVELLDRPQLRRSHYDYVGNFFPLGVFYAGGGTEKGHFENVLQDLRDHHMNTIWFCCTWIDNQNDLEDGRNRVLDTMAKYNIKAIMPLHNANGFYHASVPPSEPEAFKRLTPIMEEAKKYPAHLAYFLWDEPHGDMAHKLQVASRVFEDIDPIRPGIVNLIGINRIEQIQEQVDGKIVCIDPYAASYGNEVGDFSMSGFGYPDKDITDYIDISRRAIGPDGIMWVILQTHNFMEQLREPTPAEVRAMSWIALSRGAKSLIYFVYQSEQGWRGLFHEGQPTDRYKAASQVVKRIEPLIPIMVHLDYMEDNIARTLTEDADAQTFVHSKTGDVYLIALNRNVFDVQNVEIELNTSVSGISDLGRHEDVQVRNSNSFTLELEPGEGTVLLLRQ